MKEGGGEGEGKELAEHLSAGRCPQMVLGSQPLELPYTVGGGGWMDYSLLVPLQLPNHGSEPARGRASALTFTFLVLKSH